MEKFILLGASRGLGWCVYQQLLKQKPEAGFLLSSRKIENKKNEVTGKTVLLAQDFSHPEVDLNFVNQLAEFQPTTLMYFAGGGPYGLFQDKKWSDHLWSLRTSFLYPAELIHLILAQPQKWPHLRQIAVMGSAVAEDKPDPKASSYSAAKHALKGLIDSIKVEQKPQPNLILFSPPYMQTDMLPANSHPRLNDRAENPVVVADRLIEYIEKASR